MTTTEDADMASESSLPPSPGDIDQPAEPGHGGASVVLAALFLLPIILVSGALILLWNEYTNRPAHIATGASGVDVLAPTAADRRRVSEGDQGIEFSAETAGGVYMLKELSTGKPITEDGEPVYVTADGSRVRFPTLLEDNFTNPGSGWDGRLAGGYAQGEYRVLVARDRAGADYARHSQQFGDFIVRTDARLERPTTGVYLYLGFRFRERATGSDGYVLVVTPDDRTFRLELWQQVDGAQTTVSLIGDTRTSAIEPGTAWNRLVVRARGPELLVFINGQQVGQISDESLPAGTLALGVGYRDNAVPFANADARFANLVVTSTN
jgi:hypothetical protein